MFALFFAALRAAFFQKFKEIRMFLNEIAMYFNCEGTKPGYLSRVELLWLVQMLTNDEQSPATLVEQVDTLVRAAYFIIAIYNKC